MPKSVDDLVAALPEARSGSGCWVQDLEGRALEFVEAVKAREATGVKVKRGAIIDVLKREFDVTIGEEAVRKHLLGRCRCE